MTSLIDGACADLLAPASNSDTVPIAATPQDRHAVSRTAGKAHGHREVACVVYGLGATLPVRHEEVLIAGPLIEAAIEMLTVLAANDNEESP